MNKKKIACIAIAVLFVVSLSITGAYAYLTSRTNEKTNAFVYGDIKIELTEPNWKNDAKNISPNETIPKDPLITNTGDNEAFVYIKVSVPKASVDYINNNTVVLANQNNPVELFSYNINENWTEFMTDTSSDKANDHYYYFNKSISPNQKTTELFNTVTFIDVIEGQVDNSAFDIKVTAYGVQTLNTEGKDNILSAWNKIAKQEGYLVYN